MSTVLALGVSSMPSSNTVSISVPADVAPAFQAIVDHLTRFREAAESGEPEFAREEAMLTQLFAAAEVQSVGSMLGALDPTSDRIEVNGRPFRRLKMDTGAVYSAMRGTVRVQRGLYRQAGVRNGPTLVPMELRAGIVEGRYTPSAGRGLAALSQAVPSREADLLCKELGVLPHSRSAHFRTGVAMGTRWAELPDDRVATELDAVKIPDEAASMSVSADRVSMPMAEPREPTPDDIEAGIKRPISVNFRMAFAGVTTLYDKEGTPLLAIRHAHVPTGGRSALQEALAADIAAIRAKRPDLRLVALSDGAPEMQSIVDDATAGYEVSARMTDFYHLSEHLADALKDTDRYVEDTLGDWERSLTARDDAIDAIEAELRTWALEHPPDQLPKGLHEALTFIENRRDRLRYATAKAAGLPIGSGSVEATCKTVVETRMKRAGSRWTEPGAQAILDLRSLATSNRARWETALADILDSYRVHVTQLPAGRPA